MKPREERTNLEWELVKAERRPCLTTTRTFSMGKEMEEGWEGCVNILENLIILNFYKVSIQLPLHIIPFQNYIYLFYDYIVCYYEFQVQYTRAKTISEFWTLEVEGRA